jgi:hypothetical protein
MAGRARAAPPGRGVLRAALAAGLVVGGAAFAPAVGWAQSGPVQLVPLQPPPAQSGTPSTEPTPSKPGAVQQAPLTQPAPGFGAAPAGQPTQLTPPGKTTPTVSGPVAPKGIVVDKLGGIDVEGLGTLDPGQGGLGMDLWQGSPRPFVERLIAALPAGISSPTLRALAHRLLLSTATPPAGTKGADLIALRAAKLAEMSDFADVKALTDVVPAHAGGEGLERLRAERSLNEDGGKDICPETTTLIRQYPNVYWQKLQIYCQALAHKPQQVDMAVSLLHDEGADKDPAFFTLVDALMGRTKAKVAHLPDPTPLDLAMMAAAKQPLPEDVLRDPRPVVLRAVASSREASPDLRLAAAERAAMIGALSDDALVKAYEAVPVSDQDLKSALSKAQSDYGPKARVLLYRAAKAQSVPTARAEALVAALSLARAGGVYPLAVAVNLPLIAQVTPSPELAFASLELGRALFYAGKFDAAMSWLALARQDSAGNPRSTDAMVGLWPFTRLAAVAPGAWDNDAFLAWYAAQKAKKGAEGKLADGRAARLLGLLAALGVPVAQTAWQSLVPAADAEQAAMPSVALWRGLQDAAAAGRHGETILLALIAVGGSGPANANPIALDRVIEALRKIGLEAEAHRLAIEAAIAAGV